MDATEKDLASLTSTWMDAHAIEEWCWRRYHEAWKGCKEEGLWLDLAALACVTTEMAHECFLAARGKEVHGL